MVRTACKAHSAAKRPFPTPTKKAGPLGPLSRPLVTPFRFCVAVQSLARGSPKNFKNKLMDFAAKKIPKPENELDKPAPPLTGTMELKAPPPVGGPCEFL